MALCELKYHFKGISQLPVGTSEGKSVLENTCIQTLQHHRDGRDLSTCQPKRDEFYFTTAEKSIFNTSIPRDALRKNPYGWERPLQAPSPTWLHSPALHPAQATALFSWILPPSHFSYSSTHLLLSCCISKRTTCAVPSPSALVPHCSSTHPAFIPASLHPAQEQLLQTIIDVSATLGEPLTFQIPI